MSDLRKVSSSPHIRDKATSSNIMRDVVIALLPAAIFGVFHFGVNALVVLLVTIATSVATEYIYEKYMHKPVTIGDYSAVVTGLLLGMNLPSSAPWWMAMLGSIFAVLVVKQLFGGLGQNFMNPALAGRCFLLISFAGKMSDFTMDGWSGATPLAQLKAGETVDLAAMFIGKIPGTIGEVSVIALLVGGIYLVVRKVISLRIPVTYILTVAVFAFIFGKP